MSSKHLAQLLSNTVPWPQHNTSIIFPKIRYLHFSGICDIAFTCARVMCANVIKALFFSRTSSWKNSINEPFIPITVVQLYLKIKKINKNGYIYYKQCLSQSNLLEQDFTFLSFLSVEGKSDSTKLTSIHLLDPKLDITYSTEPLFPAMWSLSSPVFVPIMMPVTLY